MATTLTFFPVDNGDMTLIKLGDTDATTLLIDVNIRKAADDPDDETRDVAGDLRERLKKDKDGRPYVDAFLLSHPDEDHCRGLARHFHLGPLAEYPDDEKDDAEKKIVIREMWSSPIVFRRASKDHVLCDDAQAFNTEARRRVKANRDKKFQVGDGDRILVMGEDIDGKTDDILQIVCKVDEDFSKINGKQSAWFTAHLLAPLDARDDEEEEACLVKNNSSVIVNFSLAADGTNPDGAKFLSGGDAEVFIWNRQWGRHSSEPEVLEYDIMQAPHHCSWHSLSYDSWKDFGEDAKLDEEARKALAQARDGAIIVASCKPISDKDGDPPCTRAKREYESILKPVKGTFYCTGEYPSVEDVAPLVFTITAEGVQPPSKKEAGAKAAAVITTARTPMPHGAA